MDNTDLGISRLRAGEASAALVGNPAQLVFQVRERSAEIKYLGETGVLLRSGLFTVEEVVVVAVLFRVGRYVTKEYITWWDYHQPESPARFAAIGAQEFLSFHFYGDNCRRERTFIAINPLQKFFVEAIEKISPLPAWNPDRFLAAQIKIRSQFPQQEPLWHALPAGDQT